MFSEVPVSGVVVSVDIPMQVQLCRLQPSTGIALSCIAGKGKEAVSHIDS